MRISTDKDNISLQFRQGSAGGVSSSVTATIHGSLPKSLTQLYIKIFVEGEAILPNITTTILSNTQARFDVFPRSTLAAGTYTGKITFYACSDAACTAPLGGTPITLPYSVNVIGTMQVQPGSLDFDTTEGSSAAAQVLNVIFPDPNAKRDIRITTQYAQGQGWLSVNQTVDSVSVVASAAALAQGDYSANLTVTPLADTSPAVTIPVRFHVAGSLAELDDINLVVNAQTTDAELSAHTPVRSNIDGVTWTASSDANWLVVTRAAGNTDDAVEYSISKTALNSWENFSTHTATITITPSQSAQSPQSFTVSVRKELPEIDVLGPHALMKDREAMLYIRGRGFAKVSGLVSRLSLGNLTPISITPTGDTQITVRLRADVAGQHVVGISNALNFTPPSKVLHVIDTENYTTAVVPVPGKKRSVVFDPVRKALYAANTEMGTLTRARFTGSGWATDAVSIPAILDVGLGPNGSEIIVTTSSGTLSLLDPETLGTIFSLSHPSGFASVPETGLGISTTNDGRSWLTTDKSSSWNTLSYFDYRTRTIQLLSIQPELRTMFYNGPWTAMSRNGERLLVFQSSSISPRPPMLYMDASTSVLKENSSNIEFVYSMSLSDDGNRALLEQKVYDADFKLIGEAVIPDADYSAVTGVLSPDGSHVYLLASPVSASSTEKKLRLYVFDAGIAAGTQATLPLSDSEILPSVVDCPMSYGARNCSSLKATISLDGKTLFFTDSANLTVVPIPAFSNLNIQANKASPPQVWPQRH
ncbi:MAG: hypothetical protein CGU28_07635 [Candidatus Dactylopiibacterium carminicum]|uniref:BACON domain-containing protein n=2 Tax=Candidatus Dactylopiibacterium carminicum TaxID=857335 RepID=A0A272EVM9_9RHOO|nr:hypothetical protein BGI27_05505 [Candidatus Dactylopiibacterium carminicum]PAS94157.1 MAG: hypothetical protein CGU29_04840 [Candidatus Dactylopiibacterium carminicum]PAS96773.1 MAG: hypothetical protein CGU28_07635 [Candidatus Dactylopiibacterium carminicum]PAS99906.1 MAG: hypothetical protein BSR46_05535 [Candidatus Dactylopiibacterium carminicum]